MNLSDLTQQNWKLYDTLDEYDEFLKKAVKLLISGIPSKDKQGHYESIRFNIRPSQMDIVSAVWEAAPEGLYRNKSEMYRALLALGCFAALHVFSANKDDEKVEKMIDVLMQMNYISSVEKIRDVRKEYDRLRMMVIDNDSPDKIDKLRDLEVLQMKHEQLLDPEK